MSSSSQTSSFLITFIAYKRFVGFNRTSKTLKYYSKKILIVKIHVTYLGITSTANNSNQIKIVQTEALLCRMLNNDISMISSNSVISFVVSWIMATTIICACPSSRTNGCYRFSYWYFRSSFELTLELIPTASISPINGLKSMFIFTVTRPHFTLTLFSPSQGLPGFGTRPPNAWM